MTPLNFYSQIIVHYSRVFCSRIDSFFFKDLFLPFFAFVMIGSCRTDRKRSGSGIRKGPQAGIQIWDGHRVIELYVGSLAHKAIDLNGYLTNKNK